MATSPTLMRTTATLVLAVFANSLHAQERIDYEAVAKIRKEGRSNSQIMRTLHFLTDVHGPRITGSPNYKAAADWVVKQTTLWGFADAHLEPWDFGHPGWLNERFAGYVKEHFGTFESPKPEFATFNGYFNVDSGTGRIRGGSVFGPKEAGSVLRDVLAPFEDFGLLGASATASRRSGGTDSTSFNEAGLPGIGLGQDPIQYNSHTWHTNLDTYERIIEDDAIKSAIAIAGAVYHLAMREEMLPRFTKEKMPAPPPSPTPTPSPTPAP